MAELECRYIDLMAAITSNQFEFAQTSEICLRLAVAMLSPFVDIPAYAIDLAKAQIRINHTFFFPQGFGGAMVAGPVPNPPLPVLGNFRYWANIPALWRAMLTPVPSVLTVPNYPASSRSNIPGQVTWAAPELFAGGTLPGMLATKVEYTTLMRMGNTNDWVLTYDDVQRPGMPILGADGNLVQNLLHGEVAPARFKSMLVNGVAPAIYINTDVEDLEIKRYVITDSTINNYSSPVFRTFLGNIMEANETLKLNVQSRIGIKPVKMGKQYIHVFNFEGQETPLLFISWMRSLQAQELVLVPASAELPVIRVTPTETIVPATPVIKSSNRLRLDRELMVVGTTIMNSAVVVPLPTLAINTGVVGGAVAPNLGFTPPPPGTIAYRGENISKYSSYVGPTSLMHLNDSTTLINSLLTVSLAERSPHITSEQLIELFRPTTGAMADIQNNTVLPSNDRISAKLVLSSTLFRELKFGYDPLIDITKPVDVTIS